MRRVVMLGFVAGLVLGVSGMAHGFAYPGSLEYSQANENRLYKSVQSEPVESVCDTVSLEAFSQAVGEPVILPVTPDFEGTWVPTVCYPSGHPDVKAALLSLMHDGKEQANLYFSSVYDLPNRLPKVRLTVTALMVGGGPALVYGFDNFYSGVIWHQNDIGQWQRHLGSGVYTPKELAQLAKAIEGDK